MCKDRVVSPFTLIFGHLQSPVKINSCVLTVGGNWRKPTQTQEEHTVLKTERPSVQPGFTKKRQRAKIILQCKIHFLIIFLFHIPSHFFQILSKSNYVLCM